MFISAHESQPVSNLHKPRTKRSGEKHMGTRTSKGNLVTLLGIPDSDGKGCLYPHELAKNEAQTVDVGSGHFRRGLLNFPKNGSLSANKFGNVDALRFPSTNFISNALSSSFHLPPAEPAVQDQWKMTKVDPYPPEVRYQDDVPTYPFVPEPVFPTDVSETEPYYPVYEPVEDPCSNECLPFDEAFYRGIE
ncbi:hypothetical protein POM88_023631 [Heracleum sosnowskyi]|uniref:Uncharacterized protein n=1 Tax=Heracleum sosnowskyi TaxID=360622 RepID=A0AAD8II16_9APIA|nr:hypothetical protein POM88_023631 [Heracleum sosnowskyi]